jgi:methylmalonyl-CoA mutase C-terminal domain/subunit
MEVVYFRFGVVAEIVEAAVQEDVDVVAVSIMTSGQVQIAQELIPSLERAGLSDVPVIMGGTIPEIDFEPLMELGVDRVFLPGIPGAKVADYIRERVSRGALSRR